MGSRSLENRYVLGFEIQATLGIFLFQCQCHCCKVVFRSFGLTAMSLSSLNVKESFYFLCTCVLKCHDVITYHIGLLLLGQNASTTM